MMTFTLGSSSQGSRRLEKPSKKWQNLRRATLERVRRTTIEPLTPLYVIYVGVCVCYLTGFLRFQFFDHSSDLGWITAAQLLIAAFAGTLVPVLTGSVLTLHFTHRRLDKLVSE